MSGISSAAASATSSVAACQPTAVASQASGGRKTSCPVAVLAASRPIASPRLVANQRLTIVAPSTIATTPTPRPDEEAPEQDQLPGRGHQRARGDRERHEPHREIDRAPDADRLHQRRGERAHQAVEEDVDRDRRRDRRAAPAEGVLERHDQHRGRGAHRGRDQQQHEGHADRDPGIVHPAVQRPRDRLHPSLPAR